MIRTRARLRLVASVARLPAVRRPVDSIRTRRLRVVASALRPAVRRLADTVVRLPARLLVDSVVRRLPARLLVDSVVRLPEVRLPAASIRTRRRPVGIPVVRPVVRRPVVRCSRTKVGCSRWGNLARWPLRATASRG